ncbi:hypothetical protein Tco_1301540 [Tanacetum coccineum]
MILIHSWKKTEEERKSNNDWDHLLDFNIDDIPLLGEEGLSPFLCKMGKSSHNKKRAMENLNFFYQDIGTSSSAGGYLTQEEAAKEATAIRMSQKFALLEEERPIIETMAYHDKYKKILDEVWKDKVELDGKIVKEDEEAVKRIKGEALKEKYNPGAFIFPIRLEGHVNENALADTGHQNGYANLAWVIANWMKRKGAEDVVRSLSAPIYYRDLDTITLRDLIDSGGKLILEDPQPGVPRVGIPRPPRAYMVYNVPMLGAYNPPRYAQPQYDQYYQQYPPPPP